MKIILLLFVLTSALFSRPCCYKQPPPPEPPKSVQGWKEFDGNYDVHYIGEFLLKKGESTDNGDFGVAVVDLIPPTPCVNPNENAWEGSTKIVLKFFRASDRKVICEQTFLDGGNLSVVRECEGIRVSVVETHEANAKEGWVHFYLKGVAK